MTNNPKIIGDVILNGTITLGEGVVLEKGITILGGSGAETMIGRHVHIGAGAKVTMANIGNYATLEEGVVVDEGVYTGDYSLLLKNTHMPKGAKLPSRAVAKGDPFSIVRGLSAEELKAAKARGEGL